MLIIGLNGGMDPVYSARWGFASDYVHDSAAVLLHDGKIVAAIEEERLNRIKHTNKSPFQALRFCLEAGRVTLKDIDRFAFYISEPFFEQSLKQLHLARPDMGPLRGPHEFQSALFLEEFGAAPDRSTFRFVNHHYSHAMSAYGLSGFDEALILAVDGAGEAISTLVGTMVGGKFTELATKSIPESLGFFYLDVIRFLGYAIYDEYKVMGLAPYGDPARLRALFSRFYSLLAHGDYHIHKERIPDLLEVLTPRRRGEPFSQIHMDIAAALQEALEVIVFHMLSHWRNETGLDCLALAGGVAQNSTMNGKLLSSGLFRDVYIPPAAADSGCCLGAALAVAHEETPQYRHDRARHAYWGRTIGDDATIGAVLAGWADFLDAEQRPDLIEAVAALMENGAVVGWVQGRSEFGPRALGNRSIIADPRPSSHKDTINAMIKKREAYRPFAPSVLADRVGDFFVLPNGHSSFPFMSCVLPVRPEWRETLGAITHIDGTARLQTVERDTNPLYWALIHAFERRTGIPILLNTSFNNNAEPIVDSTEDAVVCFLTSGLDYLAIGNWLVRKAPLSADALLELYLSLPVSACLISQRRHIDYVTVEFDYQLQWNYAPEKPIALSPSLYRVLEVADGKRTIAQLLNVAGMVEPGIEDEIRSLWDHRIIILRPYSA